MTSYLLAAAPVQDTNVVFRDKAYRYLAADFKEQNRLLLNREKPGNWEAFTLEYLEGGQVRLRSANESYVGVVDTAQGGLFAGFPPAHPATVFTLEKRGQQEVVLRDHKGRYVRLGEGQQLFARGEEPDAAQILRLVYLPPRPATAFSRTQVFPFGLACLFILVSIILFQMREDKRPSLFLLLAGSFCLRLFASLISEHLHLWDEQFHALVAKNMMSDPFAPKLYAHPVKPYHPLSWTTGHIWLHKQPLFLWQMAGSMKLFGAQVWAMRLPSVLMSTLLTGLIYRVGSLSLNKTAAYYAALLFAFGHFALELTAGAVHTDHNDLAFVFYVSASIWAWTEYEVSPHPRRRLGWVMLIGLMVGAAILTKWLTGLLVFSGWGLSILAVAERRRHWPHYRDLALALLLALLIALPWQIYILEAFPEVSRHEFAYNGKHFFTVVEGHGGNFWWHFRKMYDLYGIPFVAVALCLVIFVRTIASRVFKVAFMAMILVVYLFFSLAATKMLAFTFSLAMLMYLALGAGLQFCFNLVILNPKVAPQKHYTMLYHTVVLLLISGFNVDVEAMRERHTAWKTDAYTAQYHRIASVSAMKSWSENGLLGPRHVLFNCREHDAVPIMFFNDLQAAYPGVPSPQEVENLRVRGYKVAVLDNFQLPHYLLNDPNIFIISGYWSLESLHRPIEQ